MPERQLGRMDQDLLDAVAQYHLALGGAPVHGRSQAARAREWVPYRHLVRLIAAFHPDPVPEWQLLREFVVRRGRNRLKRVKVPKALSANCSRTVRRLREDGLLMVKETHGGQVTAVRINGRVRLFAWHRWVETPQPSPPIKELLNKLIRRYGTWKIVARQCGVTQTTVYRWRCGANPSEYHLLRLTKALTSPDHRFDSSGPQPSRLYEQNMLERKRHIDTLRR